jgi:hypothetical protein
MKEAHKYPPGSLIISVKDRDLLVVGVTTDCRVHGSEFILGSTLKVIKHVQGTGLSVVDDNHDTSNVAASEAQETDVVPASTDLVRE